MKLPRIRKTVDSKNRELYWIKTHGAYPWTRISGWWGNVLIRNKMARWD